jgi:hypothetical protein
VPVQSDGVPVQGAREEESDPEEEEENVGEGVGANTAHRVSSLRSRRNVVNTSLPEVLPPKAHATKEFLAKLPPYVTCERCDEFETDSEHMKKLGERMSECNILRTTWDATPEDPSRPRYTQHPKPKPLTPKP